VVGVVLGNSCRTCRVGEEMQKTSGVRSRRGEPRRRSPAEPARRAAAEDSRRAGEERRGGGLPQRGQREARRRIPQLRRREGRRSRTAPARRGAAESRSAGSGSRRRWSWTWGVSKSLVAEVFAVATHLIFIYASSRI
jgi:hypothetical protein